MTPTNSRPPLHVRALRSCVAAMPDSTADLDDRRDALLDLLDRYMLDPDPKLVAASARYVASLYERHAMEAMGLLDRVTAIRATAAAVEEEC